MARPPRQVPPSATSAKTTLLGTVFEGRVRLERLPTTQNVSARTFIQGKYLRKTTGESTLNAAKRVATSWYKTLLAKDQLGERIHASAFGDCAEAFLKHIDKRWKAGEISEGQRNNYHDKWSVLTPLLAKVPVSQVDSEFLRTLRVKRGAVKNPRGRVLSPSTLKKDFVFILGVLNFAKKSLKSMVEVPDAPSFEGKWSVQRRGRPFLTEDQYKTLHQLAKKQADEEGLNPRTRRQRLELYWFILISVGGALRVGEAESVRWCDCELTKLTLSQKKTEEAVLMRVLGKHSRGGQREDAYVLYGGVYAFKEIIAAKPADAKDEDPIFTETHREGMKRLLKDAKLHEYRDPRSGLTLTRDRKSLRPTGITLRLDKGDNVSYRDVANWARTSVQMVADFYDQAHPEQSAIRVVGFRKGSGR